MNEDITFIADELSGGVVDLVKSREEERYDRFVQAFKSGKPSVKDVTPEGYGPGKPTRDSYPSNYGDADKPVKDVLSERKKKKGFGDKAYEDPPKEIEKSKPIVGRSDPNKPTLKELRAFGKSKGMWPNFKRRGDAISPITYSGRKKEVERAWQAENAIAKASLLGELSARVDIEKKAQYWNKDPRRYQPELEEQDPRSMQIRPASQMPKHSNEPGSRAPEHAPGTKTGVLSNLK